MKLSDLALLTLTALAGTHLAQNRSRDQFHRESVAVERQERWLTRVMSNPAMAEAWAPKGMTGTKYQELMSGNLALCTLTARYRQGKDSLDQLKFHTGNLMEIDCVRRYWETFGALRQEEALHGDRQLTAVNSVIADAYDAYKARSRRMEQVAEVG
ncbi:DUF6082 family protein [Streptomyces sp. NPDC057509]|uniref:DUF6082 family protein n=1 Tax=Streptomyces sp. NPDC057509 TaxID=3346152 RepID=UPI0036816C28